MKYVTALLVIVGSFGYCVRAEAVLYAATASGGPGELYILDPATSGIVQDIGPLNDTSSTNYPITGLAFSPITGVLYGSTGNSVAATAAKLVTIDPATALVTVVGSYNAGPVNQQGTPATMSDLAFDTAGNLFGVGSIGGPNLYSINIATGQATVIGSTGISSTGGGGLAISPGGVFYGTPTNTQFGTYNRTTGAYTNITSPARPAGGGAYAALAYNGLTLYGINSGPGSPPPINLVTFDAAGNVTDHGASVNALDAIEFSVLLGDYNFNGSVDAADYVTWRKGLGTLYTPTNYTVWRAHFGQNAGSGTGTSVTSTIPEPATWMLLLAAGAIPSYFRRRTA
jgi:hypothetical protein